MENNDHLFAQCKAYHSYEETLKNCQSFVEKYGNDLNQIYLSVPFTFIKPLSEAFSNSKVQIGADSMLPVEQKDFTESVSTKMLIDAKASFVLVGTAKEREYLKNLNASLKKNANASLKNKLKHAIDAKINPFLCINDTEIEFHDGKSKEILKNELCDFVNELSEEQLKGLHIMYDAAWISKSFWEASDDILFNAINNFSSAVNEVLAPEILSTIHLIAPIPEGSPEFAQIIEKLKNPPYKFHGFSLGTIH